MNPIHAFEQLAERGTPRGADAVLRGARRGSSAEVHVRRRWPVRVVLVGIAAVFVVVVTVTLRGGSEESGPVDTGPGPDSLFDEPTGATLIINTGYGSLVALDLDTGLGQQYDDADVEATYTSQGILLRVGDRIVYQGPEGTESLPLDLSGQPETIGPSGGFVSSGSPDRVWLYGGNRVEERTVSGRVTVPLTPFPDGEGGPALPVLGVGDLLAMVNSTDRYWEPSTGRQFGATDGSLEDSVVAARGSTAVVGAPSAIERPEDGTSVPIQPGLDSLEVEVSPDESTLAVWDTSDGAEGDGGSLVLVDAGTGQWRRVSGTSGADGASIAWSEDGQWVFVLSRGASDADVAGAFITAYRLDAAAGATVEVPSLVSGGIVAVPRGAGPLLSPSGAISCPDPVTYPPTTGGFVPVPDGPDDAVTPAPDPTTPITTDRPCIVRSAG